jgi:hypothetical protein
MMVIYYKKLWIIKKKPHFLTKMIYGIFLYKCPSL